MYWPDVSVVYSNSVWYYRSVTNDGSAYKTATPGTSLQEIAVLGDWSNLQ